MGIKKIVLELTEWFYGVGGGDGCWILKITYSIQIMNIMKSNFRNVFLLFSKFYVGLLNYSKKARHND